MICHFLLNASSSITTSLVRKIEALSILIRFQTKTELFCSVFKKICVHTYRFRIVFARLHYNAVSVLKTLLYTQCACSNELNACAFQYIGPRNWREIEATWQRLSAILDTHGRVVWRPVVSILMMSPFSHRIVFSVHTRKQRFQKASFSNPPLWRAFSNGSVFGNRFRRCSVDDSRIRSKTAPFSFENGLVWTGLNLRIQ